MDSPSDRVPERAPERFLVATEACGGGTLDLFSVLEVLGYEVYMGARGTSVDLRGAHKVGGAPRGRGVPPTLVGSPGIPWRAL